jgi:CDP-glycerol glycerophosphotransferase
MYMKKLLIKIYRHPTLKKAKKHPVVKKIRKHSLFKKLCRLFFIAVGWLPVKEKLIVFESFNGKQYSCNPKAIYEYLRETRPDLKMVWSVNPKNIKGFQKRKIPHMKRFSLRWFLTMPRANYWV